MKAIYVTIKRESTVDEFDRLVDELGDLKGVSCQEWLAYEASFEITDEAHVVEGGAFHPYIEKAASRENEPAPPRAGMSDEEYADSDAFYNWKNRNR